MGHTACVGGLLLGGCVVMVYAESRTHSIGGTALYCRSAEYETQCVRDRQSSRLPLFFGKLNTWRTVLGR